jgi:ABC-type glutathione transport system ATPase component
MSSQATLNEDHGDGLTTDSQDISELRLEEAKNGFDTNQSGISLREVSPVDVAVRNISVTVDTSSSARGKFRSLLSKKSKLEDAESSKSPVPLLENVSADMPRGSLTAIIGASGSGKTTL